MKVPVQPTLLLLLFTLLEPTTSLPQNKDISTHLSTRSPFSSFPEHFLSKRLAPGGGGSSSSSSSGGSSSGSRGSSSGSTSSGSSSSGSRGGSSSSSGTSGSKPPKIGGTGSSDDGADDGTEGDDGVNDGTGSNSSTNSTTTVSPTTTRSYGYTPPTATFSSSRSGPTSTNFDPINGINGATVVSSRLTGVIGVVGLAWGAGFMVL